MFFLPKFLVYILYFVAVNIFIIFLHYLTVMESMECFACKELDFLDTVFDYIIVGGGSAGSIMARRLAEDKKLKILLLEAGGQKNSLLNIPSFGVMLQRSVFDWQHKTSPQTKACLAMENQQCLLPMGKILGGSSMLNNMIYVRGHPQDFPSWYPNMEFSYHRDILPYYQKLEASMMLSDLVFKSPLSQAIVEGAAFLKYAVFGATTELKTGFYPPKVTMWNGRRFTSADNLHLAGNNLIIHTSSFVHKVVFNATRWRGDLSASGVRFEHLGDIYTARARKGVILSAGVVGSPKILMLSGVGPAKHLNQMGVHVLLDLPVGENLQDHVTTGMDLVLVNATLGVGVEQMLNPISAWKYFVNHGGPWTSAGCETLAFLQTENNSPENPPDLQFMVLPVGVSVDNGVFLNTLLGLTDRNLWQKYYSQINTTAISILPIVLHPYSRGYVRLKNKNPATPPVINPRYLTDPRDIEVMLKGLEVIKKLIKTPQMAALGAKLNTTPFPGCEKLTFDSRAYWECYIRHMTLTVYHPVGTCYIGGVVNADFKVKGVSNLYVVDASVLPTTTSGNPLATVMMLAEKAADLILNREKPKASSDDDGDC